MEVPDHTITFRRPDGPLLHETPLKWRAEVDFSRAERIEYLASRGKEFLAHKLKKTACEECGTAQVIANERNDHSSGKRFIELTARCSASPGGYPPCYRKITGPDDYFNEYMLTSPSASSEPLRITPIPDGRSEWEINFDFAAMREEKLYLPERSKDEPQTLSDDVW